MNIKNNNIKDESLTNIEVAITLPVYNTFTYSVPQSLFNLISIGKRVIVPFGKRKVTGYIISIEKESEFEKEIKQIIDIIDESPIFPMSMVPFFKWIANYYIYPIGNVIKAALPNGLNVYESINLKITDDGKNILRNVTVTPLENEILNFLNEKPYCLKEIRKHLDKNISNSLLCSMRNRGLISFIKELKGGTTKEKTEQYVTLARSGFPFEKLTEKKAKIIEILKERVSVPLKDLKKLTKTTSSLLKSLEKDEYINIFLHKIYRDPFGEDIKEDKPPVHNNEQKDVISTITDSIGEGFITYLLAGVTGSGKTEVYLEVARETVNKGYTVLVLVPEIALISQMEKRFRARFGKCIAVLHSGLSDGERFDQWIRISKKEIPIVIGARSAIFAPLENIGIIIADEEHDPSYKQEKNLRYNARDLAIVRAKLSNCIALIGSATPSVQSYYNVHNKNFFELKLKNRIEERPLPAVEIVDLRKYKDLKGDERLITPVLYEAIKNTLSKGNQILLFLNRRGYANFPVCASCGNVLKCKNCDISLTLHKEDNTYLCHYCGFCIPSASCCQTCGSLKIKKLGIGTEKLEAYIKSLFPLAKVSRMDKDTTTKKGSILCILKSLKNREIDILIGTQMIAKGHDFPNITLVGIISADLSLNFPDFRAGERTFQLLTQVAGRAGRGDSPGRVILQTYTPEHFCIVTAKDQDFTAFYNKEISFRKDLNYPPFSRMIQIKISGPDKDKTKEYVKILGDKFHFIRASNKDFSQSISILGPVEAPIFKIANKYRWQIILKTKNFNLLQKFVHQLLFSESPKKSIHDINVVVDVDPFQMM